MQLTMLCKDDKSGVKGCPAIYLADTGELVIQGPQVEPAAAGRLEGLLSGEAAVRIAAKVVLAAAEHYRAVGDDGGTSGQASLTGCPADSGELVVRGSRLDSVDLGKLENLLPGETAVCVAPEVVLAAAKRCRASVRA